MDGSRPTAEADERWRMILTTPAPFKRRRRINARIPSSPRCKLCASHPALERRSLELKGKSEPVEVVVVGLPAAPA